MRIALRYVAACLFAVNGLLWYQMLYCWLCSWLFDSVWLADVLVMGRFVNLVVEMAMGTFLREHEPRIVRG